MYNKITDELYIGNANSIKSASHFDLVVNCTTDMREPKQCAQYIRVAIMDLPCDEAYKHALEVINKTDVLNNIHLAVTKKKRVLVHCYAGEQRSCAIVACYLCKYQYMSPSEAIAYIQERHTNAFNGGVNLIHVIEEIYSCSLSHQPNCIM